jgi:hypothetical protein
MGSSAGASICYGAPIELESEELEEQIGFDCEDTLEDWWLGVTGFKPSVVPFTEEGEYAEGVKASDAIVDTYFSERSAWRDAHPMPVEVVTLGCGDSCTMLLAVPGTVQNASDWEASRISIRKMVVDADALELFREFISDHCGNHAGEEGWYLCPFYG